MTFSDQAKRSGPFTQPCLAFMDDQGRDVDAKGILFSCSGSSDFLHRLPFCPCGFEVVIGVVMVKDWRRLAEEKLLRTLGIFTGKLG